MLILTRRIGETIVVGDKLISITVINVRGNQVAIGVSASPAISVDRLEICNRKRVALGLPPIDPFEAKQIGSPRTTLSLKKEPA